MRIQQYIFSIFFVMTITGCTKDFKLDSKAAQPLIVIEGRISNMWGPYYVRITRSGGFEANPDPYAPYHDSAEAVKNALVIITDDTGIKDTLVPGTSTIDRWVYYFRDSVTYSESSIDSVFTTVGDRSTTLERGYYQTTKIKGQPGHTYYLEVQIGDTVFRSSAYMPAVPVLERTEWMLDSTLSQYYQYPRLIPVAWFKDPPGEKNYYGINWTGPIHGYRYDHFLAPGMYSGVTFNAYPYYVFDDRSLTGDLNRVPARIIPMNLGNYVDAPWRFYSPAPNPVRLYAFTKEAYDYFNITYRQLEYNGNIYKPAPTSARGNISGGALGLFYATGISDKLTPH
jgi:hypothetical protein